MLIEQIQTFLRSNLDDRSSSTEKTNELNATNAMNISDVDPLQLSHQSQSQHQTTNTVNVHSLDDSDRSLPSVSASKQFRRRQRQNNPRYGRFLTQRSTQQSTIFSDSKQNLLESQINVQNLLAKEIQLRCEKNQMQVDLMRKQKRIEEMKLLIEEKKAELEIMKLEKQLQMFLSGNDAEQSTNAEQNNN